MRASGYALDTTWRTLRQDMGVAPADVLRRADLADDLLQQPTAAHRAARVPAVLPPSVEAGMGRLLG